MTDQELQTLCGEWQERLRLRDWKVKVRVKRAAGMDKSNVQGECEWVLEAKKAFIKILDPIDYPGECVFPQDQEKTLVHELLHLHLAAWTDDSENGRTPVHGEQAIDCIAEALVEMKREEALSLQDSAPLAGAID